MCQICYSCCSIYRHWMLDSIRTQFSPYIIVYYKSLSDSNWHGIDYNWAHFYKILCVEWEGNKVLFWMTNMTNYYLFLRYNCYLRMHYKVLFKLFTWLTLNLLITYKRILYVNKLSWKDNVFMSITWKDILFIIFLRLRKLMLKLWKIRTKEIFSLLCTGKYLR